MSYQIYVDPIGAPSGSADARANAQYSHTWKIVFDTPVQFVNDAAVPELPGIFSVYPTDPYAILDRLIPQQDALDPSVWWWRLEYNRSSHDPRQYVNDYTLKPAVCTYDAHQYERPCYYDVNSRLICNSAGDLFNPPPTIDDSRTVVNVQTYVADVPPSLLLDYRGKINDSPLTIEGIFVDQKCARIQAMRVGPPQNEMNRIVREVTLSIELRDPFNVVNVSTGIADPANGGTAFIYHDITVYGWQLCIQDAGYRAAVWNSNASKWVWQKMLNGDGTEPTHPLLLDGKGNQLAFQVNPGSEGWRVYDVIPTRDFSQLNLPP